MQLSDALSPNSTTTKAANQPDNVLPDVRRRGGDRDRLYLPAYPLLLNGNLGSYRFDQLAFHIFCRLFGPWFLEAAREELYPLTGSL